MSASIQTICLPSRAGFSASFQGVVGGGYDRISQTTWTRRRGKGILVHKKKTRAGQTGCPTADDARSEEDSRLPLGYVFFVIHSNEIDRHGAAHVGAGLL